MSRPSSWTARSSSSTRHGPTHDARRRRGAASCARCRWACSGACRCALPGLRAAGERRLRRLRAPAADRLDLARARRLRRSRRGCRAGPPAVPPSAPTPSSCGCGRVVAIAARGRRAGDADRRSSTRPSSSTRSSRSSSSSRSRRWIMRLVAYPRLIQAWSMFASDAPMTDESVVVEAITADGRHVDPYSEVASRYRTRASTRFRRASTTIRSSSTTRSGFPIRATTIRRFSSGSCVTRCARAIPDDAIVRFDAYEIENDSPPPGQTSSRNVRKTVFLSILKTGTLTGSRNPPATDCARWSRASSTRNKTGTPPWVPNWRKGS